MFCVVPPETPFSGGLRRVRPDRLRNHRAPDGNPPSPAATELPPNRTRRTRPRSGIPQLPPGRADTAWVSPGGDAMTEGGHATAPSMADPVTGAVPRALLAAALADALAGADRTGNPCALFLFDVDFFKTVNDAYGHLRGDEVLHQLADRVKGAVRPGDTLFRYGGGGVVLLLPGTAPAAPPPLAPPAHARGAASRSSR